MFDIHKRMHLYLESSKLEHKLVAQELSLPETTFSNWYTKEQNISVYSLIKISSMLSPLDRSIQEEDVIQHLKKHSRKNLNVKIAFLIAHLNGFDNLLNYVIDLCENHSEMEMQRCFKIFRLFKCRLAKSKGLEEIFLEIDGSRPLNNKKHFQVGIFCDILSMLILSDLGKFDLMATYKQRIEGNLKKIKSKELIKLYNFWIESIWGYSLLRSNDILGFQEIYKDLMEFNDLGFFPVMQAVIDIRMGESSLFSDEKAAFYYLEKACNILSSQRENHKYKIALNTLNFLRIIKWKDIDKIDINTLDIAEKGLYFIQINQKDRANELLDYLERKNNGLSPIQRVYRGMANNDLIEISKAIDAMKVKNDFFYAGFAQDIFNEYKEKSIQGIGKGF
ncbi:AimR family lysis-lysogeny pheromone receptor [Bacillus pseudomycoides]|uniref:AimR family lysis-lysogeny pheromone receptor n=1 Tax=Bacillus pseudomycoides TaxID=64104 RepID=UPI000BFBA970|nr:AimR family lysis-lysogeny pheromone receptor [Bacillus pseudomycoides]PGE04277.1 transcriptional regulator [Bacillus pseudomycoides]PHG20754.1 transcriptional regulator [Bacillus pseudomycoides]